MQFTTQFAAVGLFTASLLLIPDLCTPAQAQTFPRAGQTVLTYQNRLYLNSPQPTLVLAAFYFTDVAGLPGPLVEAPLVRDQIRAYVTALYDNSGAQIVFNGDVSTAVFVPGHIFKIYFNSNPDQTWDNPESFATGELVATYESSIGTSASTPAIPNPPAISNVTQTYFLRSSKDFHFRGKTYNFRQLIPNGFTNGPATAGTANFPAIEAGFPLVSAGAGSFVAIGGLWSALPVF